MLAIAPAPAPGPFLEQNLRRWQRLGITGVLSMMEHGERPGWETEAEICRALDLDYHNIPIQDHGVPLPEQMQKISQELEQAEAALKVGARIVVHCYAGIGRSGMATCALLMIAGVPLEEAMKQVSLARGLSCPETEEQREWLASFDRFRRLSYT